MKHEHDALLMARTSIVRPSIDRCSHCDLQ
jgi:hypothetical protein